MMRVQLLGIVTEMSSMTSPPFMLRGEACLSIKYKLSTADMTLNLFMREVVGGEVKDTQLPLQVQLLKNVTSHISLKGNGMYSILFSTSYDIWAPEIIRNAYLYQVKLNRTACNQHTQGWGMYKNTGNIIYHYVCNLVICCYVLHNTDNEIIIILFATCTYHINLCVHDFITIMYTLRFGQIKQLFSTRHSFIQL
jgi:hypothetical protein